MGNMCGPSRKELFVGHLDRKRNEKQVVILLIRGRKADRSRVMMHENEK